MPGRARALGHVVFTEVDTWDELRQDVKEAVSVHFAEAPVKPRIRMLRFTERVN